MARILAHLIFWPFMTVNAALMTVLVVTVYFPMVGLKAAFAAVTGAGKAKAKSEQQVA